MDNQFAEQQRYIKIGNRQIAVTEEVYQAYKRPAWREDKRQKREKRCRKHNGTRCMEDCSQCSQNRTGKPLSIERFAEVGFHIIDPTDMAERLEEKLLNERLSEVLGRLLSNDRLLIELLFFEELSEREVAAKMGLSQKGINKRKHRVLKQLRKFLGNVNN